MRRYLYEILAILLIGGSIVFFRECIGYLARRDYVAAVILMFIGLSVISVGKEMARLALIQKD
ncbi:MAG: hypothetical protein MJE77_00475 [Proteobacteria bacterium]|nr:hypothetical protein [Pseudomonadota bacterium]